MNFANGLKTIVVATELDGRCEAALEYARKFAGAYSARVVLAYGMDPVDYVTTEGMPRPVVRELTAEARAALDRMAAELLREGIPSHSEIRQGMVAQMLVDVAWQHKAGLIIVGTRGNEGAGPVLVGSIAEQVVRMAPCPVLAVSEDWNAGPFRPEPGGPVMLAAERNEALQTAANAAYALAETFKRPLLVVHARIAAETSAILNPSASKMREFMLPENGPVTVQYLVKDGKPADALAHSIEQYHPGILVVGVKRASEMRGRHGTAFTLLAKSRVPVLCVPPETASAVAGASLLSAAVQ